MATRAEYKAQGYTDQQINDAVAKKSATVQKSAGPDAPISAQPVTNPNLVPLTSTPVAPVSPDIAPAMREGTSANPVAQPVQTPQAAPVSPDIAPSERPGTATVAEMPVVAPVSAPKVAAVAKKTTAPKVAAAQAVNYDSSVGRDQEILANLSEGYKNAPELFSDEATFKASYGYETADEGKKRMLDAFYQAKQPKNEDQFFSILSSGGRVWNESSKVLPAYKSALKRFEDIQKYKGFTTSQFSSALSNGQILPGSRTYNDLQKDPVAKANMDKAITLNRINGVGTNENKIRETVMGDIGTSPFGKAVSDGYIDASEADSLMTTPEIKAKQDQIEPLKNEYDRLKASYDDVENQVDEELKGTGATSSYRDALIGARRKNIYKNLQVATDTYNNAIGSLADMKKTQAEILSTNLGLYKDQQAFQKQKELALYQQQLGLEGKQKEFEQQLAQKAAIAKDPVLATQDLIDQYRKIGVFADRSDSEIIDSVKRDVESGMSLGQSLSNLNKGFKEHSTYKAYVAKQFPSEKGFVPKIEKIGENSYGYMDSKGNLVRISDPSKADSWIGSIGDGKVTFLGGRVKGDYGMDIAGPEGFDVTSPVSGTVLGGGSHKDYGNYLDIRSEDGGKIRLSHLDGSIVNIQSGTIVNAGDFIAKQSNTGTVMAPKGRGVLDVTTWDSSGKVRTGEETKKYLSGTSGEVKGSAGVPLSYQRRIEQMVPVQLRNSDAESAKLMADIKNMHSSGLSPEDATLLYLGFNVTDPSSKSQAMEFVSQARGLGESLPEDFFIKLSDYVNKGNINGAKSYTDRVVEGTIKKQVGEDFVSTPNLKFAESTLSRIERMVNRNKDKIGPLSGRIADVEKKLVNDPDYQALKTLLSGSLADTRRAFGGTAVSQSELQALKDFIGLDTNMPIENLLSGLRTNLDTLRDKYNQQRGFYLGTEPVGGTQTPVAASDRSQQIRDRLKSLRNR